jgi:aryl-alcohol dehydrogenase-like predicted oxidoreductase
LPDSQRAGNARKFMTDDGFNVVEALGGVASAHGVTQSAVAIAWLLTRPAVVAPIVGANSVAQLQDLLPAADLALTADDLRTLDMASQPFSVSR